VQLAGRLVERDALRQTPAGVDVIAFRMLHESQAMEAGGLRDVRAEVDAVAFEGQARLLAGCALDARLAVEGFLCARSRRSKRLVLHVTKLEFTEGA
jgi:primosomal replication protein N